MIKKKICIFIVLGMLVSVMFIGLTPEVDAVRGSATVKGYVRDQNNTGIPNVWVWYNNGGWNGTNANETGYYSMGVTAGHIWIWANADGFLQNGTEIDIADGETKWVNLTLSPKPPELCTLKGYVKNSETGDGMKEARVNVWDEMGYSTGTETSLYPVGYFEINTMNGTLKASADADNYLWTEATIVMIDYQVTWQNFTLFYAPQNSVVKGIVTDIQTGMPIPELRIGVSNHWNWGNEDYTDDSGYYEMDTIAGQLWLDVWKEDYYQVDTEFDIGEDETKWINITMYKELAENATLNGYINDTSGNPINDAEVRAYNYGEWDKETHTDSSGYYEMSVVATADLNVNLTLLVTADQHGSNITTFNVHNGETKQINLNLEKDNNPSEIKFGITQTGNISTNNPVSINGTIKEKYLKECGVYLAQYKETLVGQKAYALRAFYRYTAEEEDGGWEIEEELILTPTGEPDTYSFSIQWDAITEGGWIKYDGTKEYIIPDWYNPTEFRIGGTYYNNTNPLPREGEIRFNKITGELNCLHIYDIDMDIYPEDDPGMFASSQQMLFFDATGQLVGSDNIIGEYFSVANATFEYDSMMPTDKYVAVIYTNDYGDSENSSTTFIHIDNTNPETESITITPESPLNATNTTFTITFNEAINQSVQLNVSFGLTSPYTTHTITGSWQTSTTWQGTQLITNITGDGVNTIWIENIVDFAKNPMDPDTSNTFIIDTVKPVGDAGDDQIINQYEVAVLKGSASTDINGSGIINYTWGFNGVTYYDEEVNHTFHTAGIFSVTLTIKDAAGNWDVDTVTITVKDTQEPAIEYTDPMLTDQPKGKPVKIELEVTDNVEVANVTLYYRSLNEAEWKSLLMVKSINNIWSGTIPAGEVTDDIFYYFVATDDSGNNVTKPADGKENPYRIGVSLAEEGVGVPGSVLGVIAAAIIAVLCLFGFVYYKKKPKETGKKVEEVKKIKPRKVKYNRGSCYIIREQEPETSFKVFSDFVKKGAPGLCISRTTPEDVKAKHKLKNVELLWLTTGREDEHSINPTHIEKMTWTIKEFIRNNKNSAVLLDGVEYLIVQNNFLTILKSLQALEDTVSINKSMLIIPISPMAISEKEMSYLERDFVVV